MDDDVAGLIELYGLRPLPVEQTLYASTWVSELSFADGVPAGTAIVGLYTSDPPSRSLFHRLTNDEVWHFYAGDPIRLVLLFEDGTDTEVILGSDVHDGQRCQAVVPANTWQAGELLPGGRYALFGCTMAPGFSGQAFTGGRVDELMATFPQRRDDIERLGVPPSEPSLMPEGFNQ